jgi:O-antigen/teichoic acid export membrane protein
MTYLPSVTRNTVTLFISRFVVSAVNFLVGIVVIRHLGADRFGTYSVVFAFLSFFSIFTTGSGIDPVLVREVSRGGSAEEIRRKSATAVALRLALGAAGIVVAALASLLLYGASTVTAYIMVSALSLAFSFNESNSPFIVGYNARLRLFVPQLLMTLVTVAFAFFKLYLVYGAKADVFAFILADAATPVAVSIAFWGLHRLSGDAPFRRADLSVEEARYMIRESAPLLASSLFVMLYMRIDQILISKWLGPEPLGNYNVAVRITETFNFIPVYLAVSLLPVFSRTLADENRDALYEICFRFLNLFIFPVILFFTLFSAEVVDILFPGQFPGAAGALRVLIWSEFFVFAGVAHSTIVLANGLQRYDLLFVAFQAVLNIALNCILIGKLSIEGASWASVISYGAGLFIALLIPAIRRFTVILFRSSLVFLAVSLSVAAAAFAAPAIPKIPLGLAGVLALLVLGVRKRDLALMRDILREIVSIGQGTR